jgi:hypothetical protein
MMLCEMLLCLLQRMQDFMYYLNKPMFFCWLPFNFQVDRLTL